MELRINYSFYGNTEFFNIEIIQKYRENFCFTELQKYGDFITLAPGWHESRTEESVMSVSL